MLYQFYFVNFCKNEKLVKLVTQNLSNIPQHWESHSYKWDNNDDISVKNRMRAITSYYFQSAIDAAAAKQSVRLTPTSLLYTGHNTDKNHLIRSAQYLHRELPVRIAHRIAGFRSLPFIVACNPTLLAVHELYIRSFKFLTQFPAIKNEEDEDKYSELLRTLLNNHKDVLTMLAEGLKESQKHVTDNQLIKSILDRTLTSRLGVRMLAEHHLALKDNRANYVGIIHVNFSPKTLIESHAEHVGENFRMQYGIKPIVIINGHIDIVFPYIRQPLDYIINELLKNAFRATIEAHKHRSTIPNIKVTIISNDDDFIIRISDQGLGIPKSIMNKIWDYHFSCNHWKFTNDDIDSDIETSGFRITENEFEEIEDVVGVSQISQDKMHQPMHGFGFGLPTSRAYTEYLGGFLKLESMRGYGTDVYLCLRQIDGKSESFRI